jgi:lysophospholipase L1-like esterase
MAIFDINTPVEPDPRAAEEIGALAPEAENEQPETTGSPEELVSLPAADPLGRGSGFPLKIALAIAVIATVLTGARLTGRPNLGLDVSAFQQVVHLRWPTPPVAPVPAAPLTPAIALVKPGGKLPPVSAVFSDDSNSLDPFFAALWQLEQVKSGQTPAASSSVVTVLHYGDSPTTADLITGDIRAQLQQRFGDAGRGYTLVAKPWAWYGHRGVEITGHGWKMRTGVGLMRQGIYGLGGAAFEGQPGASSLFRLTEGGQSSVEIEYLAKPSAGSFAVEADGQKLLDQSTAADTQAATSVHIPLPPGTTTVSLRPTSGSVTLFGADFRTGSGGVLYDSLGLNGATTSVLARVLDPNLWKEELDHAAPALIVVNYGSNESSFGNFVHKQYAAELRLAIQRIRVAAPSVPILIMSPMDRGERSGLDDIETMSTIPEIVAIQRQVATETHCAFFDTYDAMGGSGTMARWFAASPRLVTADLLHPTPQGAPIVASLLVQQLSLGYDRWKMQHGIALPAPAPTSSATPVPASKTVAHRKAVRQRGKKADTK